MKQYYTYLHCKPDGIPFYVGKGSGKRAFVFQQKSKHHKNIVAKYGKENIEIFIFRCDSEEQALEDEAQQISQLRDEGYELVNISIGGESGATGAHWKLSPETRAKQSACKIGNKSCLGKQNTLGKIYPQEVKARMAAGTKAAWARRKASKSNTVSSQ